MAASLRAWIPHILALICLGSATGAGAVPDFELNGPDQVMDMARRDAPRIAVPSTVVEAQKAASMVDSTTGIEWIPIDGGQFDMRDDRRIHGGSEVVKPTHVASFYIAKTEVTVAQYDRCVSDKACPKPRHGDDNERCNWNKPGRSQFPMNCVNWDEIEPYLRWAGGRLPTEEQWKYAATSRGRHAFPWGGGSGLPACDVAVIGRCGHASPEKVCSMEAGNTEQGLCDMVGNVSEFLAQPEAAMRSIHMRFMGGSWLDPAEYIPFAGSERTQMLLDGSGLGFRLVREDLVADDSPRHRRLAERRP